LSIALAYDANVTWRSRRSESITLKLRHAARLGQARELLLTGLEHAERCRRAVLAEGDDEREWVPSPRQKNHALPLPVDEALFETWAGVLSDVRGLIKGEQGIEVTGLAQLGDHKWKNPPPGYLDLGAFFSQPRDFVLRADTERSFRRGGDPGAASEALGQLLGPSYKSSMPPSPLLERLRRMAKEVERGEETFERKLRYLLWLN
jgi:hypothetical protein